MDDIDVETEISTTPTVIVNKENDIPTTPYDKLNMSGTLIVSCTPRSVIDTGLRARRSMLKVPESPSEPYGTPKSVLSEFNDETIMPSTPRYTPKSSMHLIDLTTPHPNRSQYFSASRLRDKISSATKNHTINAGLSTPVVKSSSKKGLLCSALKNSAVKPPPVQLKKKLSLAFEKQKSIEKSLPASSTIESMLERNKRQNLLDPISPHPKVSSSSNIEGIVELSETIKLTKGNRKL